MAWTFVQGFTDHGWKRITHNPLSRANRAEWLHKWSPILLRRMGVEPVLPSDCPRAGLITSNHLSYLDILVLSAAAPCVFVSKAEVKTWPVMGLAANMAGTIYIRRERKADTARVNNDVVAALQEDLPVVIFPEGTTSDGTAVLPFRSPLLESAVAAGAMVTPAHLSYEVEGGSAANDVCYWGDMTLLPHLINLLARPAVRAMVTFGEPVTNIEDRKTAARDLHLAVLSLATAKS